jgi:hypothetical protein
MIGRAPSKADLAKLVGALKPVPNPYGFIEFLLAVLGVRARATPMPGSKQRKGGRPPTRTPENDRRLLDWFAQLKAAEELAQGRKLTDKQCIEAFAKKHRLRLKQKTILTWLSDARRRATRRL